MAETLLARAERVRHESRTLARQFVALCELRTLENDYRDVIRKLAMAMGTFGIPLRREQLRQLLMEAEEVVTSPPPGDPFTN